MTQGQVYRPSMKTTRVAYAVVGVVFLIAVWFYFSFAGEQRPWWAPAIALLLFIFPLRQHLQRLGVKLILEERHLVLETGILSKTTRTLDLAKVQDVTVRQTLGQRMLGVGDITIETAGESSALTASNFDSPKALAQRVLDAAHHPDASRASGL